MNRIKSVSFIGGDKRQIYMKEHFDSLGYKTNSFIDNISVEKSVIRNSDAVIFPLPMNKFIDSEFINVVNMIKVDSAVFGGMVDEKVKNIFDDKGIKIHDYFKREDVAIKNVVPTVQGILKTIFNNIDYTLFSSRCAVFGYGKTGKMTADTLASLGADVTVFARKESDLALIETKCLKPYRISEKDNVINEFQIIVNTVPSTIIDKSALGKISPEALIVDIASEPFGVDYDEAKKLGIKALLCPSLPAKTAPVTAGKILAEGIFSIMKEEGYA